MKEHLSAQNPFGLTPHGIVWQMLRAVKPRRHMDFGTHDGALLRELLQTGLIESGVGLDADTGVVEANRGQMPPQIELEAIEPNSPIRYPDESFDSISALGVIEHIHDQQAMLKQCHRLLRRGGHLLVAVPGKHLFSFLDLGNFKFVFPTLHKWVYTRCNSPEEYHRRYVECANGLFGDIEVAKMWHEHFSVAELSVLLEKCGFQVIRHDGTGFFRRVIYVGMLMMPGPLRRVGKRLVDLDAKCFSQAELVVLAQKVG